MLGTIVNAGAIIFGALLGNLLKGGFPEKYKSVIMQGVSLTVILIGLSMALETESILVLTLSIVTGGILGEVLRIEDRLDSLGRKLERSFAGGGKRGQGGAIVEDSNLEGGLKGFSDVGCSYNEDGRQGCTFEGGSRGAAEHGAQEGQVVVCIDGNHQTADLPTAEHGAGGCQEALQGEHTDASDNDISSSRDGLFIKGFVTGSLVFCVGAMAIMGSLESGLTGRHTTLFIKSILDGVTSTVFASTMGIGVAFSALPVFLYQGAITLAAVYVKPFLTDAMITEMTAVGGLLIFGIGLNLLTDKLHIKIGNLLPAIFIAIFFVIVLGKFSL